MPQFEHQQRPEPVAVVGARGDVVFDQLADGLRREIAAAERGGIEQRLAQVSLQLAPEPV